MAVITSLISLPPNLPKSSSISLHSSFSVKLQSVAVGSHSTFGRSVQVHAPVVVHKRAAVIAKVSSGGSEEPATASGDVESTEGEKVEIQNLPLESKLQLKLEQKMKMKIAKKIRLRRNRLNRKRALRKKGRWPPSKMKKLKNV
ncbi:hypothetical protein vseg_007768 [Gypsophila vaccaria]